MTECDGEFFAQFLAGAFFSLSSDIRLVVIVTPFIMGFDRPDSSNFSTNFIDSLEINPI